MRSFHNKLVAVQAHTSRAALWISPRTFPLPLPMQRYDDPFLPLGKAVISATRGLACAYVFDFMAYLSIGAAGAVALERTIAYAGAGGEVVTILHGVFADGRYASLTDESAFGVDAITVTTPDVARVVMTRPDRYAFPVHRDEAASGAGYWPQRGLFMTENGLQIMVAPSDMIYADASEQFTDVLRRNFEQFCRVL